MFLKCNGYLIQLKLYYKFTVEYKPNSITLASSELAPNQLRNGIWLYADKTIKIVNIWQS